MLKVELQPKQKDFINKLSNETGKNQIEIINQLLEIAIFYMNMHYEDVIENAVYELANYKTKLNDCKKEFVK